MEYTSRTRFHVICNNRLNLWRNVLLRFLNTIFCYLKILIVFLNANKISVCVNTSNTC